MKSDSTLEGELRQAVLEAAFEKLAPDLEHFADRHALQVERFKRGSSIWTFLFRHPKGGVASLQLSINLARETGDLRAMVLAHWWVDIADEQRRLAATFPTLRAASLAAADVLEVMERIFARVLVTDELALTREIWLRRREDAPEPPPPRPA
jgi:hypothetical protein